MTESWRIRLLGKLEALQGEQVIARFRTQKTGLLLAYLALYRERDHPREVLLDTLWPDSDLSAARNSLSVALNSLRRQIEPEATLGAASIGSILIADRSTVRLRPDAIITDVMEFESAREAGARAESDEQTITDLILAAALYTGELLPGYYDDWVLAERERLADSYLQILRRLSALLMQRGDFDRALNYAHLAVQADPLSETSRRLLMRLYAALGRPAAAREQLHELEQLRKAQGEAPPTAAIRELALRLAEGTDKENDAAMRHGGRVRPPALRSKASLAAPSSAPFVPARPAAQGGGGLPHPFTRFFGRTDLLEQIQVLLHPPQPVRLLTLTGTGGTGKTRLAVEAAARLTDTFPGGVFFAPLADLSDTSGFLNRVRSALRLTPSRDEPLQQIANAFAAGGALLILDNLEHLLGHGPLDPKGAAASVRLLLERVPALLLLATSRQALGISGEQELFVPPLPVPSEASLVLDTLLDYPSIQLFADRARAQKVDFRVTPRNCAPVAAVCAKLEGIPLAIELAAAWAKLFTPAQVLDRLSHSLELLESRSPNLPSRQRSLRGAIAWSCDLLSPETQQMFYQLSVFRGGATPEAVEAVCAHSDPALHGRTMEGLARLRDASLIVTEESVAGSGEEMRIRLLEPLREFAEAQLEPGGRNALRQLHAAHFVRIAETADALLQGPEQAAWFDRMEADHANFRAALEYCVSEDTGLRLAAALALFWKMRGHLLEGAMWLERTLASGDGTVALPTRTRAKALKGAGILAYERGDLLVAETLYNESRETCRVLGDRRGQAIALGCLGNVAYRRKDFARARTLYTQGLEIHREQGDRLTIAGALGNLGNVAQDEGDLITARALQEESLALSRELGEHRMTAYTLHNLGNLAHQEGDLARARTYYEESLPLKRALGDRLGVAFSLHSLGFLMLRVGDTAAGKMFLVEALVIARATGGKLLILLVLEAMGWYALLTGQYLPCAKLLAASAASRESLAVPHSPDDLEHIHRLREDARHCAPASAFDAAWTEGATLRLEQAADLALTLH
ncbi:MAG: tetratricopeptide repeat protein [Cytophagales bacterium]|nr:tetratricopeptide repeat protein [Armatimonadota bacterium]